MGKAKINPASTTGFCFGVGRAVEICEDLIREGKSVVTLGPIIHNRLVVAELEQKGIKAIDKPSDAGEGNTLVIRSHGIEPKVYDEIIALGLEYKDATCPCVGSIHEIVKKGSANGQTVLVAGDVSHPEVMGIAGHCSGECYIFSRAEQLKENIFPETGDVPVLMVAQTTFNLVQYTRCIETGRELFSNIEVFETVCDSITERQREAHRLGLENDVCIVIGGRGSSNTEKLREICSENAVAYTVESKDELNASMLRGAAGIGVVSGASTPARVIQEVLKRMDEILKENDGVIIEEIEEETPADEAANGDMNAVEKSSESGEEVKESESESPGPEEESKESGEELPEPEAESNEPEADTADSGEEPVKDEDFNFETALEKSLRQVHRNQRVFGVVTQIRANEVVVDIGSKHTGIIPAEELGDDSTQKPEDIVSVGDKLNLLVIATNDQEGITTLSKKRLDSSVGLEVLMTAADDGEALDAYVLELVNNGLIAIVKGVRIFVPASQATLRYGEKYDHLVRTNVKLKILEVNPARRRTIGSIRAVLLDELNKKRDAFWSTVEVGKEYTGKVKSLTSYGAFVDLGGVDGMVHISELSWQRVRNPSDIVSLGEEITVRIREVDAERKRISLSYRREEDNPWNKFEMNFAIGDIFPAKVVSLTKFGAFVRILPGVDGLVHVSEILQEHIEKASDVLSVGDDVMVKLIDIAPDRRRISLSMKYEGAPVLERKVKPKEPREEQKAEDTEAEASAGEDAAAEVNMNSDIELTDDGAVQEEQVEVTSADEEENKSEQIEPLNDGDVVEAAGDDPEPDEGITADTAAELTEETEKTEKTEPESDAGEEDISEAEPETLPAAEDAFEAEGEPESEKQDDETDSEED